jgi:hypothetical protein
MMTRNIFLIETYLGSMVWDVAEADTPENAICAADTLLHEGGIQNMQARITNTALGKVIWAGATVASHV